MIRAEEKSDKNLPLKSGSEFLDSPWSLFRFALDLVNFLATETDSSLEKPSV